MPSSLFHYQKLVDAHLVALLAKRMVKLSRPNSFNDPWDCRVHFGVPSQPSARQRLVDWLADQHAKRNPQIAEARRGLIARAFVSEPTMLEIAFLQMEQAFYKELCRLYRVYCLSELCSSPLMWAHYADSHRGICLEFDARAAPFTLQSGATKVIYRRTYPEFDIRTLGYEPLVTKSNVWAYEREWRIIAEERGSAQSPHSIKTDEDFLMLPPGALKSIIVGCLASEDSRQLVERLVRTHASGVLVRHATLATDKYDLIINPPITVESGR